MERENLTVGCQPNEIIMLRKNTLLFFFIVGFVTVSFGQDNQITNDKYKFTLSYPNGLLPLENGTTVLEFHGTKKKYGEDAIFFLKRIMPLKITPIEDIEPYLKDAATLEGFDKDFIGSMRVGFPDIESIEKSFIYFNDRPAVQGTYSFTREKTLMKGRYMLVLVREQSAIYVFSWTSKRSKYKGWNKVSENSVESLSIR